MANVDPPPADPAPTYCVHVKRAGGFKVRETYDQILDWIDWAKYQKATPQVSYRPLHDLDGNPLWFDCDSVVAAYPADMWQKNVDKAEKTEQ